MRFTETYTPLGPKRKGINPWNYWSNEEKFESIRLKRNYILNQTDWIAFPDVPHPKKQAWLDYRQALRNIPQDFIDPDEVVWPTEP